VKESVAENFNLHNRLFLAGDASHLHSVNGGQGLNTGLADAFNIIWKIAMVEKFGAPVDLLQSYQQERKTVALEVVKTSAELVRATKQSTTQSHAKEYVKIVERRAGFITGMGIQYGEIGVRLHDFLWSASDLATPSRIYPQLSYQNFTLLIFGRGAIPSRLPAAVKPLRITNAECPYQDQYLLVRPDGYIAVNVPLSDPASVSDYFRDWHSLPLVYR
jgi:hypothetical protein